MSASKDCRLDLDYLLQRDLITNFIPSMGKEPWQVVYAIDDRNPDRFDIFCALLEREAVKEALKKDDWDLAIGDGLPGFSQSWQEGKETTTYHRFGTEGVRPLVITRKFYGAWPSYLELCEEFRHFHNLAENCKDQEQIFLDFDESGYPIEVAKIINHERVEIEWTYLRRFLAATQLYLAIYFNSVRYSKISLGDVPQKDWKFEHKDDKSRYSFSVAECNFLPSFCTFSRLLGKVIIAPPPVEECGKWPFNKKEADSEVSFIIGVSPDGRLIESTSNPDRLSNSGTPNYLTPVYFRKEVLQKYYAEPNRYSVKDGYLECLGLWVMQIDNDHPTHVAAFLGDLGRDLPYRERLHWRQFNVLPPADVGISETCFHRSFLAEFAEPKSVDLVFQQKYKELNEVWREQMGWPLFLEPKPGDEHVLTVHIPVTDSQRELDEQILALTRLLVDSLNESELEKKLVKKRREDRGIRKLERFLEEEGCENKEEIIRFLQDLQGLRSAGAAHRKGSKYKRMLKRLGLVGKDQRDVMEVLLTQAVNVLRLLLEFVQGKR
ncbi:MAG: hypothetical protein QHH26_13150 [Armatimonadota bacterium]|nr:hypothetical protein [Armatimonadota bacterium]